MVSAETLLNYPYFKTPFTVDTNDSYKQLGAFIIHNIKAIDFLPERSLKPQHKYSVTQK